MINKYINITINTELTERDLRFVVEVDLVGVIVKWQKTGYLKSDRKL